MSNTTTCKLTQQTCVAGGQTTTTSFSFDSGSSTSTPSSSTSPTTPSSTSTSSSSSTESTSSTSTSTPTPTTETTVVVSTPSSDSAALAPTTVTLTSTSSPSPETTPFTTSSSSTSSSSSASSTGAALASTDSSPTNQSGLPTSTKIAVAVVVPVVAVAIIVGLLLFFWRRRKQRKDAEDLRRKEVEEYGFNPNNDPTLPAVGQTGSHDDEMTEEGNGYRGWGAAPMVRKASTNLSSGNGAIGMAVSDGSARGPNGSPTQPPGSEAHSGDPLLNSPNRPPTADSETIGALGAAPAAGANRHDIHRGPSNASSSYSAANRSEGSAEAPVPGAPHPANYYNNEYYDDGGFQQAGPYADGSAGGGQPVIRDVQARRNTRIENPSVFPQQGNAGIAQNF
ncbi:MAG: hypothetical protein M1817_006118 [Caeruleum heppii]|nr:MAG: hypothetical protein M1817_006118 [Caeruleum heppii]